MTNPSKQKGTRAETSVVRFLQATGIEAKRKALTGSKDCGDIDVAGFNQESGCIIEVKTGKMTANPSRAQLEEWYRQAMVEGKNAGKPYALCVVRYRRALKDADVYFQWCDKKAHMYLDEFCEFYKHYAMK